MEVNAIKLRFCAQRLLQLTANEPQDNLFVQNVQKFIRKKKYVPQDVERLFCSLSEQLACPAYTVPLAVSFEEQLLLLLSMVKANGHLCGCAEVSRGLCGCAEVCKELLPQQASTVREKPK
ncbi:uncharacterized protein LOC117192187 isoform X2 [Drosophila miranda]|uniref:uncharacterized protein LOC117192187 isoform X2 n=1 Tax=Drosophila miranda TaxID=7229 RepID=UPI00143F63E7|nr:uncharacterized protein LOC117192187 isoform X2 [Drosophila miranda]